MSSILTNIGRNKLTSATPLDQLTITHIAVGDGNGSFPPLLPTQTALTNEVWRGTSSAPIKASAQNVLIFEGFIPSGIGGFEIREMAIFDQDGDMIAIGTTSLVEKPDPSSGNAISLSVRLHVAFDSNSDVELIVQESAAIDHNGLSNRSASDSHPASAIAVSATAGIGLSASDLQTVLNALKNAATKQVQENQNDNTSGRVLLAGAHGLGRYLPINDANSATKSGFYSLPVALGAANSPITDQSGALIVANGGTDEDYITQIWLHSNATGARRMFFRVKAGSEAAWTAWVEVYTSASAGTAVTADKQTSAADTTAGRLLINGAHGLGSTVVISNNWNNINVTGFYRNASTTQAELPIAADQLMVIHLQSGSGNAVQLCMRSATANPETWRRSKQVDIWGAWHKVFDSSNLLDIGKTAATARAALDVEAKSENDEVGCVKYFCTTVTPAGYIKANGAAISRTAYAALFAKVGVFWGAGNGSTTFNVPDLRGDFIRTWDDSRGIDSGRTFGSLQADEIKSHNHVYRDRYYIENSATLTAATYKEFAPFNYNGSLGSGNSDFDDNQFLYIDSVTESTGGTETRPRNTALIAWIKY